MKQGLVVIRSMWKAGEEMQVAGQIYPDGRPASPPIFRGPDLARENAA
jgi:hypothetical protein